MLRRNFLACMLAPAVAARAQNPPATKESATQDPNIQVQVNVVNVPVTVTDAENRFVTDLEKTDFSISEDGKPVEVRYFSRDPKQPLVVGFLLDISNTARLYFKTYQEAITDLAYVLLPGTNKNKGFLGSYATQADFLVKPTSDGQLISEKIMKLKPGGGSAMLDAIYTACTKYYTVTGQPGEPKRILIVVGDGHDNNSKASLAQVLEAAQRAQVVVYAVSTVGYGFTNEEEQNLVRLTEETGGRVERPLQKIHDNVSGYLGIPSDDGNYTYTVGTGGYASQLSTKLYTAITNLAGDVQHQYMLGYTPPTPLTERKFRTIKVSVNVKGGELKVRARKGYYPQ